MAVAEPAARPVVDWGAGHYENTAAVLLPAAELLVQAAAVRPGERVLDVGTGTGNAAVLAAAAGADVLAVDPSERLLDVGRVAAQDSGVEVDWRRGEAAALPAPDTSIDCVLSNFGVIFASDPAAAAAEVARVLRPGGRAVFTAWLPGGAVGACAATAQELVRAALGGPPSGPGFPWCDRGAVAELFSRHGMAVTELGRHPLVFTAASPAGFLERELASHPMAIAGFGVLQRCGQAEQALQRLLMVLTDHNESADAFASTSHYVVLEARRG